MMVDGPLRAGKEPQSPTSPANATGHAPFSGDAELLSRACTIDTDLNNFEELSGTPGGTVHNWGLRSTASNDFFLRGSFNGLLRESAELPAEDRLVMYDACDSQEVVQQLGAFRKRLDARRSTKPNKPAAQLLVCTPFGALPHRPPSVASASASTRNRPHTYPPNDATASSPVRS